MTNINFANLVELRSVDVSGGFVDDPDWVLTNDLVAACAAGKLTAAAAFGQSGIDLALMFYDVSNNALPGTSATITLQLVSFVEGVSTTLLKYDNDTSVISSATTNFQTLQLGGSFAFRLTNLSSVPVGAETMVVLGRLSLGAGEVGADATQALELASDLGSTSVRFGANLTVNGSGTGVDWSPFVIDIIDSHTGKVTIANRVNNAVGYTDVTPTNIATQSSTFVGLDAAGAIVESPIPFTELEVRSINPVGRVLHTDNATINGIITQATPGYNLALELRTLYRAIGPINLSGNNLVPNGTGLQVKKMAGEEVAYSAGRQTTPATPHLVPEDLDVEIDPITFGYLFRDLNQPANNPFRINDGLTALDPNQLDKNLYHHISNPNLEPVSPNKFTIQPAYFFTGGQSIRLHFGQDEYNSLDLALSALDKDEVAFDSFLRDALFLGWWIMKEGILDLEDAVTAGDALFKKGPKINLAFNLG
jgi:hypothetical protein